MDRRALLEKEDEYISLDLESNVSPNEFIAEVYDIVAKRHRRMHGVYPSDFLYDMIPSCAEQVVWWMSFDHPIALMLKQNDFKCIKSESGPHGTIEIYTDVNVKECRECIIRYCREFGLVVID